MVEMKSLRAVLIVLLIILFVLMPNLAYLYTEYLWFKDLGFTRVFVYRTFASSLLFLIGLIISSLIVYLSLRPVLKEPEHAIAIPLTRLEKFLYVLRTNLKRYSRYISLALGSLIVIIFSLQLASKWEDFFLFFYGVPYGLKVPVFNTDVSFFLFKLPVYRLLIDWLKSLLFSSLLIVVAVYFLRSLTYTWNTFTQLFYWYRRHIFSLAGILFLIESASIYLNSFNLAYSSRGAVFGPGYVDVHFLMPFFKLSAVVSFLLAVLSFLTAFRKLRIKTTAYLLLASFVFYLGGAYLIPSLYQSYVVSPNELKLEKKYIANNIRMTREAYGLNIFKEKSFEINDGKPKGLDFKNPALENARLWDNQPLYEVFNQVQAIRSYYVFSDIDIDRYIIGGRKTQVAISVRELDTSNLAERAKTWVNLHLKYTHGYGAVVSSVTSSTPEGLPLFYLKDMPPKAADKVFKLEKPQIYFGEKTDNYVIVNTSEAEFGYPSGDKNVYERWQGKNGIKLNTYLRRLAFAIRFGAMKILFSREITDESVMLFDRNIKRRLAKVAPFFLFDPDPYPVIANGKIYWICDGFTISNRFPYSEPYSDALNYIRNSVKAVIDAYTGEVSLYIFDEKDPMVKTYANIFPGILKPASKLPEELREHVRYPVGLFEVQAQMLSNYHMEDVQVFYNREDRWAVAEELYEDSRIPVEPYYVLMPFEVGSTSESEFILILPFTPAGKNNLIAWMYVSSDGKNYGRGGIYKFPKGTLVYGPLQVEARINQDPEISKELTLWSQAGSKVIRGNLLVIPLDTGIIYVEPLYLKAENGSIPELKRVIVADLEKVIMKESLIEALKALKGEAPEEIKEGEKPQAGEVEKLKSILLEMEASLKAGDLKKFAEAYEKLKQAIGFKGMETTAGTSIKTK